MDFAVCCDCIYAPFWGDSYKLLLASVLELDANFLPPPSPSSPSSPSSSSSSPTPPPEQQQEGEGAGGGGTLGIISVERRNADGVDAFLALARAAMEVVEVQRDEGRGWFIYELRRRKGRGMGRGD